MDHDEEAATMRATTMRATLRIPMSRATGLAVVACLVGAVIVAGPAEAAPAGGPVPSGFEPASVSFVSANDGWVLGSTVPCFAAVCTSMVRTADGGRFFFDVTATTENLAS